MISTYRTETIPDDDNSSSVLQSSTELFIYYKETLVNCSTLSTRKPFYDLCVMFAKWLRIYANEVLIGRLPKFVSMFSFCLTYICINILDLGKNVVP